MGSQSAASLGRSSGANRMAGRSSRDRARRYGALYHLQNPASDVSDIGCAFAQIRIVHVLILRCELSCDFDPGASCRDVLLPQHSLQPAQQYGITQDKRLRFENLGAGRRISNCGPFVRLHERATDRVHRGSQVCEFRGRVPGGRIVFKRK